MFDRPEPTVGCSANGRRRRRRRRGGRPRNRWKEEVGIDLQVLGVKRWRELVADKKKNGRTLFERPKPTVGCSANGRRRILTAGMRKGTRQSQVNRTLD